MSLPPSLSIVTPSYNQGDFLETTIQSVLSQEYPGLEYRIMDGGSTDSSVEIIRRHAARLTSWCSEKDGGQYEAIDRGLRATSGEVMGWLNSDDFYLPGALSLVGELFGQFPELEWLTTQFPLRCDGGGRIRDADRLPGFSSQAFFRGANLPGGWQRRGFFIMQESTFWRRSLWERAGGRLDTTLRFAADFELWARFFRHARLYGVTTPIAVFRRHEQQKTSRAAAEYLAEAQQVLLRHGGRPYSALESNLRHYLRRTFVHVPVSQIAGISLLTRPLARSHAGHVIRWTGEAWKIAEVAVW